MRMLFCFVWDEKTPWRNINKQKYQRDIAHASLQMTANRLEYVQKKKMLL